MKSVSSRSMIRCLRTTRSARSRPLSVRSASFFVPRSIRPSASSRFSISPAQILLLGAIAGATIFLGLPAARMQGLGPNARSGLSALATGILVFLFWDVMSNAVDPINASLHAHHWGKFTELAVLGAAGFVGGLMSLVYYDAWLKTRADRRSAPLVGPGAPPVPALVDRRRLA